ncbi:uncharacterized protein N0V89_003364 [Didymosphaeria variabile]|uniref:pectinesterase n=1 Tax=Didymosphaeria variabile TaxID=1932322 RepID=A0A9W8XTE9_9PLEO|nr:uncharacterized protein N0V89_003364 [Didymosphaeria variabile]KAJ4358780.1 hypothetical protein N0V89_003364 [Didymosphaeria variabile]
MLSSLLLLLLAGRSIAQQAALSAVTVAADGTGQYTAINAAILYAQSQGIPTVTVKAGTYTEGVVIQATAAVTIVGETTDADAYSSNLVTISNTAAPVTYNVATRGLTWKNINFYNTNAASAAGFMYLRGSQNAFYSCQFVAAGSVGFSTNYASALIANSYIEAADKLIYSYPSLYIYGSTIAATAKSALITYNKGAISGGIQYNSTIVFDSCSVIQKPGTTNNYVYLASANGVGSVVLYRNTAMASCIAPSGVHVDTSTQNTANTYYEYLSTGAGSYQNNQASRTPYAANYFSVTDPAQLAPFGLANFFANAYPSVATTSLSWIDSKVLSAMQASDAAQESQGIGCKLCPEFKCCFSNNNDDFDLIGVLCWFCHHPIVLKRRVIQRFCKRHGLHFAIFIADLPLDSTVQTIYILAGVYSEQVVFPNARTGATTFRGEAANPLSRSGNTVTIKTNGGVLSSAGAGAGTGAFQSTQYYTNQLTFYNINFENSYTPTTNYQAVAVSIKPKKAGFYSCNIKSSQGTLLLNYGAFYFSNCHIEGTTDFVWGQGAAYIYNSEIVETSTSTGLTIAAQSYQTSVGGSIIVFDHCAVVPGSSSVPTGSTYLGRDYSTSPHVAYTNSYLDNHIIPAGWKVSSSSASPVFVESNNTGPGSSTTSRISSAQILSDASAYSAANVLGDVSWLDNNAIAPFSGFPDSVYLNTATTASSSSMIATTISASSVASTATNSVSAGYTVAPTPTAGQYGSVMSAVAALPNDGQAYSIYILAGTYTEQVWVNRTGKVTLRGETQSPNDYSQNVVKIQFSYGVSTSANQNELTPVINSKKTDGSGLALYNIDFVNIYPQTSNTAALAADFYGNNMAAYGCSFIGFQDTLLANQGVQVFSNCYIEGSVDFIWGYSKAYFHQCKIASNTAGAYITAQNRPSASSAGGYIFDSCYVTYTSSYGSSTGTTYLGRPWSQYAIVVYMNSYLDKHIASAGWNVWSTSDPRTANVMFGEYNNTGPGNWSTSRVSYATNLTSSQASAYTLTSFIGATDWIDMTAYNYAPSFTLGVTPTQSTSPTASSSAAAIWAHPTSGTVPPTGAVLVSSGGSVNGSYSNLTSALASLPSDSSTQIIFMYAGTYEEQVQSVSRAGPVMIIGYTEGNPGQSYASNTVTITNARGLSVSPLPVGHSDAETATFSTGSTKISMYNVNIINSDNLDGLTPSYVTLAGSIYGNHIGFYGCSFIGWQDTLLTGATNGYQYYESSYIEGAIDFIWGYSKAYFKGCTIGAKRQKSAITAQSRAPSSAIGGYIFDQCLFKAADSATVDLTQSVFLGRPYSSYATVIVKNSYLTDIINPSGWKTWGATNPQTDHITFAEYNNVGPGNWENNAAARIAWQNCTLLTTDSYPLATVMDSTDWIDMTYWDTISTPQPATIVTPEPGNTTYDGTIPPAGAYIVSKTAIEGKTTYDTIQKALDVLPTSSKVTATVFIYPGVYEEQLVLNKSGTTIFMGYTAATEDYTQNQVTITYAHGIDTQADASNSDSATVYATGNYFQAININFANTYGTAKNFATLGFGVKSSKYASLYGCQVYGNQDALLINGFFFASNSLIQGSIDMIWGSGAGYFLNTTISPNTDDVSLTASKRLTNTTAAGFVFDQCTVTPVSGSSYSEISLGRPWNNFARVAFIESYLGSCVEAAGWEAWSKTAPQTDGVLFGELANYGPGASTSGRASFATQLTAGSAAQFELASFFASTSWINMTLVHGTPFSAGTVIVPTQLPSSVSSTSMASSTSSLLSSSTLLPISTITVTTTKFSTVKATFSTTTTIPGATLTKLHTTTVDVETTITPAPVTKNIVEKTSTIQTYTVTEPDETITQTSTSYVNIASTVTPDPTVKISTVTQGSLVYSVKTTTGKASTVASTSTTTALTTVTPDPKTITISQGSTITSLYTTTAKAVKATSTTTKTVGSDAETTVEAKATTVYSTAYTTATTTKKSTSTLTCIPTANKIRRDLEQLAGRAASAPTVTVTITSPLTSIVKTSIITIPGTTYTSDVYTTITSSDTVSLKASTVTSTSYSTSTKLTTTTLQGSTATAFVIKTSATGKVTTLARSTSTVLQTVMTTSTSVSTSTVPGPTTTSVKFVSIKSTTTLPTQTITKTSSKDVTVKSTTTLPASTSVVWKTVTQSLKPTATVTSQATVYKTSLVKQTQTVTSWATTTKKNAPTCA